jgi:hypothetical protein
VTPSGAAIEARDLTKTSAKDVRALDGLGFQVGAGTVFGLVAQRSGFDLEATGLDPEVRADM